MAKSKYICIEKHHNDSTYLYCGTLQSLIENVFGYTLECGNSWMSSIPTKPRDVKSLVKAINDSYNVCNRLSDWAEESTYEKFIAAGGVIEEGEEYGSITIK